MEVLRGGVTGTHWPVLESALTLVCCFLEAYAFHSGVQRTFHRCVGGSVAETLSAPPTLAISSSSLLYRSCGCLWSQRSGVFQGCGEQGPRLTLSWGGHGEPSSGRKLWSGPECFSDTSNYSVNTHLMQKKRRKLINDKNTQRRKKSSPHPCWELTSDNSLSGWNAKILLCIL